MKKLIAVLVALAMVLSMTVMAFAEYNGKKSPSELGDNYQYISESEYNNAINMSLESILADPGDFWKEIAIRDHAKEQGYMVDDNTYMSWDDAWAAYLGNVAGNLTSDPTGAISEIVSVVKDEDNSIDAGKAITIVGQGLVGGTGGDGEGGDMSGIVDKILGALGNIGGQDPEVSAEDYVAELTEMLNNGATFDEITTKIGDDLASGKIVVSQLPDIANGIKDQIDLGNIEDNETVQKILEFIEDLGGEGGFEFPDFGDIDLPWDNGNSEGGNFLDTILGIFGGIGDFISGLFGGGDNNGNNGGLDNNGDDGWGPTDDTDIPDTGDMSFVAVAAVAAVAGAALVLTRKKENDAE